MPRKKLDPWFKEEVSAIAEIDIARSALQWEALGDAIEKLRSARSLRARAAQNGKRVQIIQETGGCEAPDDGGRYLVQPPLVARDAGVLDTLCKSLGISAVIACREPVTNLGLCPIVALGSGVIVRVQVEAPKNSEKPTCAWFDHAIEELGDHVLEQVQQQSTEQRQLDYLIAHFSAIPTHMRVYRKAIELCDTLKSQGV